MIDQAGSTNPSKHSYTDVIISADPANRHCSSPEAATSSRAAVVGTEGLRVPLLIHCPQGVRGGVYIYLVLRLRIVLTSEHCTRAPAVSMHRLDPVAPTSRHLVARKRRASIIARGPLEDIPRLVRSRVVIGRDISRTRCDRFHRGKGRVAYLSSNAADGNAAIRRSRRRRPSCGRSAEAWCSSQSEHPHQSRRADDSARAEGDSWKRPLHRNSFGLSMPPWGTP